MPNRPISPQTRSTENRSAEALATREAAIETPVAERRAANDMDRRSGNVSVPLSALLSGRRWRQAARWIGLLIFAVGATLLAYVFWQAFSGFQSFSRPDYFSLQLNRVAGDDVASKVQAVVVVFGSELLRVLYLLLLGFLASAIASKGIQFFAASEAVIDEAVAAGLDA